MIGFRGTSDQINARPGLRMAISWRLCGIVLALLIGSGVSDADESPELYLAGLIGASSDLYKESPLETPEPIAQLLPPQPIESAPRNAPRPL